MIPRRLAIATVIFSHLQQAFGFLPIITYQSHRQARLPTIAIISPLVAIRRYTPCFSSALSPLSAAKDKQHKEAETFQKAKHTNQFSTNTTTTTSKLTDWVVENLESCSEDESITFASKQQAGENDTLPVQGLCMGTVRILAADSPYNAEEHDDTDYKYDPIRLLAGRNGWGTGVHPTTRLCVE